MNLRNAEILKWCQEHRPDLVALITPRNERPLDDAFQLLLAVGFEAGRQFQAANQNLELNNPNVYLARNG